MNRVNLRSVFAFGEITSPAVTVLRHLVVRFCKKGFLRFWRSFFAVWCPYSSSSSFLGNFFLRLPASVHPVAEQSKQEDPVVL